MPTTLLHNVTWETYECLLRNYENSSSPRFAYDRGTLEIRRPLISHEETNRALATLVERVAEQWGIRLRNLGSTTFQREDRDRGFEPDTCFGIGSLPRIGRRETIDLEAGDPPPDLIIEVDVTSLSLDKLPLYAALGVPEIWRVVNGEVFFLRGDGGGFTEVETSVALSPLTQTAVNELLAQSKTLDSIDWYSAIRIGAKQNRPA